MSVTRRFSFLLLELFTTCFILLATIRQGGGNLSRLSEAAKVVATPEGVVDGAGKSMMRAVGSRKFLQETHKVAFDEGQSSSNNGDSKSPAEKFSSMKSPDSATSQSNSKEKPATGVSELSPMSSKNKSAASLKVESFDVQHEDEATQNLDNAARELVNFLHKDYGRMGKPWRKPPIHNGDPIN